MVLGQDYKYPWIVLQTVSVPHFIGHFDGIFKNNPVDIMTYSSEKPCCPSRYGFDQRAGLLVTNGEFISSLHEDSDGIGHPTVIQVSGVKEWVFVRRDAKVTLTNADAIAACMNSEKNNIYRCRTVPGSVLHWRNFDLHMVRTVESGVLLYR